MFMISCPCASGNDAGFAEFQIALSQGVVTDVVAKSTKQLEELAGDAEHAALAALTYAQQLEVQACLKAAASDDL